MSPELTVAVQAATAAGAVIREFIGTLQDAVTHKAPNDFVTEADTRCEALITACLRSAFPGYGVLGEEAGAIHSPHGAPRWIIDPIDGTTNFIHGFPACCTSIALQDPDGQLRVSAVYDPIRDELFTAERGAGAWLNGAPIHVSRATDPALALIATGWPFREATRPYLDRFTTLFVEILTSVHDIRRAGSAALDLAYVACGRLDGYWELGLGPWDVAGGALLVAEAGGIVTDFSGGQAFVARGHTIAGNPTVHPFLTQKVQRTFPDLSAAN